MSTIPEGVKMPTDRQVKKNEADPENAEDINFEWDGATYVIPADAFDDVEIAELLEDEKHISVCRQILGKSQWSAWKDSQRGPSGRVRSEQMTDFLEAMFAAAGQGNSSASSDS